MSRATPSATRWISLLVCLGGTLFLLPAGAQAQRSPGCTDAESRQMDFWIGNWEVSDADGNVVGHSKVSPIMERCALREEWDGGMVKGMGINGYDKPDHMWRQMWVDNFGTVLRMQGAWDGSSMKLHGSRVGSDGKTRELRVTLTPKADGTLEQLQERSEDGGKTWGVIFDGFYRPYEPMGRTP